MNNTATHVKNEQQRIKLAKELRLRPNTKKMFDEMIDNPKLTQREAYLKTHTTNHIPTADNQSSKLFNSDKYAIYKASVVGRAKRRISSLIDSNSEKIALEASKDVLDRTEGKATIKVESQTVLLNMSIDLSN